MSRKIFIIVIVTLCLVVSATAWTQETSDEKAVREVIEKELKGALEGKPEQVRSCYADGFVGYSAIRSGIPMNRYHLRDNTYTVDPEDWTIGITKPEELDEYAEGFKPGAAERRKKLGITHDNEVASIKVKDDCALGVTRHWGSWKENKTNDTIDWEMRTVWMLKKIKGEWKITNYIGAISRSFFVGKAYPTEE